MKLEKEVLITAYWWRLFSTKMASHTKIPNCIQLFGRKDAYQFPKSSQLGLDQRGIPWACQHTVTDKFIFFLKNFDFIKSHRNQERYWIDKENNLCCLGKRKNTGIGRRRTAKRFCNNTGSILSDNSASSFGIRTTLILYS